MSTTTTAADTKIEFLRFEATSFMGISKDSPVILDLTRKRKKNSNVVLLEGNQGVGKSSTMTAIMYALGAELDFKKENIVNKDDDTVNLNIELKKGDTHYRVRVNKSKFALEVYHEKEGMWLAAGEPKATLRKLFGPVATSPMFLKEKNGRDQIKWFRQYFTTANDGGPGRKSKEETIMEELDQRTKARREANRELDRITKTLSSNDMYNNYEANQKKYAKPVSVDAAREAMRSASEKKGQLTSAQQGLVTLKEARKRHNDRIKELEAQLDSERDLLAKTEKRLVHGKEWIEANEKDIISEFDKATHEYENINTLAIEHNQWKSMLADEKIKHDFEDAVAKLDGNIIELREQLLTLTKKYLPKMKGLELKVATGIDNGDDNREGLFYNNKSLAQLSESELWEIFLAVCDHNEVNFVFIENIPSLGSNAVAVLNQLVAHDVKVFATMQNRKLNKMEITITDKID